MKSKTLVLGTMLCLVLCAAAGQAKTTKTVQVDCAKGDSINAALEEKADALIVEISGFCSEAVVIGRDDVTLRGGHPALDGIEAPGPPPEGGELPSPLTIYEAGGFAVERLTLRDGQDGVRLRGGSIGSTVGELVDCRVEGNVNGIFVTDANLTLTGVTVAGNSAYGVSLERGRLVGSGNRIEDNDGIALRVRNYSNANLTQSEITAGAGGSGAWIEGHSILFLIESSLIAPDWGNAATLWINSLVYLRSQSIFQGNLEANDKSMIWLYQAEQSSAPHNAHAVRCDSMLELLAATLEGDVVVGDFSKAWLAGSTLTGELRCERAGDAWVDESSVVVQGGISGCDHASSAAP